MPRIIDKFIPTYDLEKFKASNFAVTLTARQNALSLGFREEGVQKVIKIY